MCSRHSIKLVIRCFLAVFEVIPQFECLEAGFVAQMLCFVLIKWKVFQLFSTFQLSAEKLMFEKSQFRFSTPSPVFQTSKDFIHSTNFTTEAFQCVLPNQN